MLGMTSKFNHKEHTFVGGDIGAYIKRLGKEHDRHLAVIRYKKLGVFCIIEFLTPQRNVFVDSMNLGKSLGNFNRVKSVELRMRLFRPLTARETSVSIANAESDYYHRRQDENEQETERWARIKMGE